MFDLARTREVNGCLEWTGARATGGYGQVRLSGLNVLVHRYVWELANGPIPDGMCVCHACDNPPCCNVDHLFLGTKSDNNADMATKGRARNRNTGKSHCKRGHEFTEANTMPRRGGRECRACHNGQRNRDAERNASSAGLPHSA